MRSVLQSAVLSFDVVPQPASTAEATIRGARRARSGAGMAGDARRGPAGTDSRREFYMADPSRDLLADDGAEGAEDLSFEPADEAAERRGAVVASELHGQ